MRYYIGFLIAIGLVIVLILLLLTGGGGKPKPQETLQPLPSYANTDAQVQLTIDGPINAPQNHQQVQIAVTNTAATYEQLQGYDGQVVNSQSYANTENSFNAFLSALNQAGFTKGNTNPAYANDTGYCPLGDRYDIELTENGSQLIHFWSTSCGSPKTFGGDMDLVVTLFQAQIPDYGTLTQNLQL